MTPQSAAMEMALQPNLASLDALLAAIRALQFQADQEIARLLEQNAAALAAAMNAVWRPIETAPKDGSFVLVCDSSLDVPVTVGAYYKAERDDESGRFRRGTWDGWLSMDGDHIASISNPTHWMPLPSPARNTRTDDDVADDRRALIDDRPDDPDYTGGGR